MIYKISTHYFKRFEAQDFPLEALTLLAVPNNSGKATLLQAIMVWNLALQKWLEKKGPDSGSKAKDRQGAPITRQEFSALPLPSMYQLWTDTHTSLRKDEGKQGAPRPMVITLHGKSDNDEQCERRRAFLSHERAILGRGHESRFRHGIAGHGQRTLPTVGPAHAGYADAQARQIFRDLVDMPAQVEIGEKEVRVEFHRRAHLPIVLACQLCEQAVPIPWWQGRNLRLTTYTGH